MNQKGWFWEIVGTVFVILCVLGLIGFIGVVSLGDVGNGADGVATDSIARVSYGGWIWQTWRVELTNDHPICTSSSCDAQRYGVNNDPELIEKLQHYAETGERVALKYHSHKFIWIWEYADPEVIYDVVEVKK